jgi:hypothetical protein
MGGVPDWERDSSSDLRKNGAVMKNSKQPEPLHVVMAGRKIRCCHCGASEDFAPIRLTDKRLKAFELTVSSFQDEHANCPEPETPKTTEEAIARWINGPDTGCSSVQIWCKLTGTHINQTQYHENMWFPEDSRTPADPSDFGRCYRLVAGFGWRDRLSEMRSVHPLWTVVVDHWDELAKLYEEELPSGRAPRLFRRMKELGL